MSRIKSPSIADASPYTMWVTWRGMMSNARRLDTIYQNIDFVTALTDTDPLARSMAQTAAISLEAYYVEDETEIARDPQFSYNSLLAKLKSIFRAKAKPTVLVVSPIVCMPFLSAIAKIKQTYPVIIYSYLVDIQSESAIDLYTVSTRMASNIHIQLSPEQTYREG